MNNLIEATIVGACAGTVLLSSTGTIGSTIGAVLGGLIGFMAALSRSKSAHKKVLH